jgi:predicted alpha/beta-hydrolase family hydrolase
MPYTTKESKFIATPEDGEVSAILLRPENATHLLVLGHGAGADIRHVTMQAIAERLAENSIATFRYNFPFMEKRKSVGSPKTAIATVISATEAAQNICPGIPLLAGGHSYGGRMTSHAAADGKIDDVRGLVFFSFPLHAPNKPGDKRAEHLSEIKQPMLFLSGTRDALADLTLLKPAIDKLGDRATLHLIDTGDNSYKISKRTRESQEDVFVEMARVVKEWTQRNSINN